PCVVLWRVRAGDPDQARPLRASPGDEARNVVTIPGRQHAVSSLPHGPDQARPASRSAVCAFEQTFDAEALEAHDPGLVVELDHLDDVRLLAIELGFVEHDHSVAVGNESSRSGDRILVSELAEQGANLVVAAFGSRDRAVTSDHEL